MIQSPWEPVDGIRLEFSVSLLMVEDRYVLQHRDDRPDIPMPGLWGLFGGRVEPGESPAAAFRREVLEEIALEVPEGQFLETVEFHADFFGKTVRLWVFQADVTRQWERHRLQEGQAVGLFGNGQWRKLPLVPVVREILERHHGKAGPTLGDA